MEITKLSHLVFFSLKAKHTISPSNPLHSANEIPQNNKNQRSSDTKKANRSLLLSVTKYSF